MTRADSVPDHITALDGVRGVAVALVILFHLRVGVPDAGFVGVDIFFVLSGFLITSLLLGHRRQDGRAGLVQFWSRRLRRLMPALLVLLVVVAVVTAERGTRSERETTRGNLVATTFYVANWHLISGNDYFTNTGTEGPLDHTWSLAVEEQFYLFWPLAVAAALTWGASRRWLAVIALAAAAVSAVVFALHWHSGGTQRAYMGTDARAFEPLLGAAAMLVTTSSVARRLRRHGGWLSALAVGAIAAIVVAIERKSDLYFRGGAYALSVAVAVLIAALWVDSSHVVGRVLSWRPLVWAGVISYGIYLWHWPLIVWLGVRDTSGATHAVRGVTAVVLTLAAAAISFVIVERPVRSGAIGSFLTPRVLAVTVPAALLLVAGFSLAATRTTVPSRRQPTVLVVGDSVPLTLTTTLERSAATRGWALISAARGGCPATGDQTVQANGTALIRGIHCGAVVPLQDRLVDKYDPDVVVWWDRYSVADLRTPDDRHLVNGTADWWRYRRASLRNGVARLGRHGAIVVFVAIEPPGRGVPGHCDYLCAITNALARASRTRIESWNATMLAFAREHPGQAAFVSVTDVVCRDDAFPCDDRFEGQPARPDQMHYTGSVARRVADALLTRLQPYVLANRPRTAA